MARITALSSATPSQQTSVLQDRLAAAKREAQKAQTTVENLRQQVQSAQDQSAKRKEEVRGLSEQVRRSSASGSDRSSGNSTDPGYTTPSSKASSFLAGLNLALQASAPSSLTQATALALGPFASAPVTTSTLGQFINVTA
jgi:hypothetical protein